MLKDDPYERLLHTYGKSYPETGGTNESARDGATTKIALLKSSKTDACCTNKH